MRFKQYVATPTAVAQARSLGLFGSTSIRLSRMAKRSAPFTSSFGNRRYEDYILTVEDHQIVEVNRLEQMNEAA